MSSDIRLRFFSTITAKGRVLETVSIGHTDTIDGTPAVSFTVTKKETALLPEHFIVAVERLVDGAWVEARNGRFVVLDSRTDDASLVQNTSYMGVWLPAHLLQSTYLHWASTAHDGVRTWTSKNVGYILNEMLTESLGRGWGKISGTQFLSWDFDATEDTSGTAWPSTTDDLITQDFPLGMSLWQIVQGFISSGYCEITSQGNVIHLYVPGGVGQDLTGTVTLGPNATSAPVHSSSAGIFTNLTVIPEKARYWVYLENTEADDTFLGRLEATLSLSGVGDDLPVVTRMAQPTLAEGAAARREKQVTYDMAGATFIPGVDYLAGDTVRLKTSSQETLRVVQTVVQKSPSGFTVTAVLGYQFTKLLSRVARGVYGGTGGSVSGGSGQPIQLGTTLAEPKAPTGLAGTPTGVWDASGLPKVDLELSWDAVTQATDDSAIDVIEYDIWSRPSGGVSAPLIQSASSPVTKFGLEPGTLLVKVRVRSVGGVWSEFSAEVSVDLEAPTAVLAAPTAPVLTQHLGVVSARWDGDLTTGTPPAQFRYVATETSSSSGGTYSSAAPNMGNAGAVPLEGPSAADTVWVRFVPFDSRGVAGTPSTSQSITVDGVTLADLDASVQAAVDAVDAAAAAAQADATAAASAASAAQGTADSAVSDAAAAQSAADAAAADAAAATGIADSKAVVLFQTGTPGSTYEDALTLWIDTTGGANTPKRWSGSAWVAVTDKAALDAADAAAAAAADAATAQSTADGAVSDAAAAQATADAAASAASAAQSAADTAQSTADGKNTVIFSTVDASGTGYTAGDLWFKRSGTIIIAQWEFTTSWQARTLDNAVIANLDAGKITTGFLDVANRIAAGTIVGEKLVADTITAREVQGGVGSFEKLSLGAVLTPGVTTERVPSQPTDQAFWAKAIDGTYVLVTPPSGYAQQYATAGSTGVTLDPTSGIARLFLTARHPVPGSRVLNCSYVATGSAPVETNLHTSPKPGQDATGYEVLSSGTGNTFTSQVVETGGQDGLGYWRVTASGVNSSNGTARLGPNFVNGPGTVVTIGMWVRASAACDIRCVIREFTNSDGTGTETTTAAATVTMVAGEWMFFSQTLTLAGTTNSWRPEFRWPTGSTAAARTFDFDDLSAVLGSTAADFTGNDLGAIWTGDRYKSTSTRPTGGIRVVTFDSSDVVTVSEVLPQSQDWAFPTDAVDYTVFIDQPSNGSRLLQAAHVFEAIGQRTGLINATLTPQGLRVQDDGGSNAVSLGVWDDQLLSINQLNTVGQFVPVASINSDGVVAGTSLETGGDYYINGIPIVGDAESATVNGVPLSVPLLERGPRGEQFSTGLGTDATSFSELALQVVGSTAVQVLGAAKLQLNSGRRYEASIDATLLSRWESAAPTSTSMLWLEMWIGDTAQDSSAPNGVKRRWALLNGQDTTYPSLTRIAVSPCASFDAPQDADGFSYILVRILRVNSSTSYRVQAWGTSDENNEPTLIIKDVGSSEVDPFVATTKVRTTSGTPSTPGSVVTISVACSFSQSWGSTASAIYTASGDKFADGRMLHQGQPGRSKMAIFGWPDLGLSGFHILNARVKMRARFISMSSGATVQFGTSAYTSPPAISKPAVANRWDDFVPSPSPRWFYFPLDAIAGLADDIADGTVRSLTLGEPTGGSEQTNVIFDGFYPTNAAGTSLVPVFEFTYET